MSPTSESWKSYLRPVYRRMPESVQAVLRALRQRWLGNSTGRKMRVAWVSPYSPQSAIGNYSEAAVAALAGTYCVTVFASEDQGNGKPRRSDQPVVRIPSRLTPQFIKRLEEYDLVVYNMGNHLPYHRLVHDMALRHPGVVIMHDLVLRHFFHDYYHHHGVPGEYTRLLSLSRNAAGSTGPLARHHEEDYLEHPLCRPVLRRSLGVIVHSDYAAGRLAGCLPSPLCKIDFPLFGPAARLLSRPRSLKSDGGGPLQLLTFGHINTNKRIDATIAAIGASEILRNRVRYTVVGSTPDADYTARLHEQIQSLGLTGVVELAGWLAEEPLQDALLQADVVVNLRNPHMGESSASLLDALAAGAPTVVSNHGFYGEFPEDVVCRINSESDLTATLERLVQDGSLRESLSRNARAHVKDRFNTQRYAQLFTLFTQEVLSTKPLMQLADAAALRLREMGVLSSDPLVDRVIAEVSSFSCGRTTAAGHRAEL